MFQLMKCFFIHLMALLVACGVAHAQDVAETPPPSRLDQYMETGMEVLGVRAPYYDEEGNLLAQLFGGHAKILEGDMADVTNLRIDLYQDGAIIMTVFAPQCFTQVVEKEGRNMLSVYSDGDVLVDAEQMTIYGRGFRFSSSDSRFEILNDSKVIVKESARNMKGLEL
jgi:hypothetical protein